MRIVDAVEEFEEDRAIYCASCSDVATEETSPYCRSCHDYWTNDAPLLVFWIGLLMCLKAV